MTVANQFLPSTGSTGGSNPFPFFLATESQIRINVGASRLLASSSQYFSTQGVLTPVTNNTPDVDQTVTAISSPTGTSEIYNISSATGGTLTHIQTSGGVTGAVYNVVITRDGSNVVTIPLTVSASQRACLGAFLPVDSATSGENSLLGQNEDDGFSTAPAYILSPMRAFSLGYGLEFDNTCVVELVVVSGSLQTSGGTARNMAYCASVLRKKITG